MSKPRIFISSTYYDLKHLRSQLDMFVESFGFESILSEKGDIAFTPDTPLDESCYREATNADVFVLIIGGRYGSEASSNESRDKKDFYEKYDSITKKEYEEAVDKDIPTYILIEGSVYSEYHTYLKNRDSADIQYAHVDSVNIFQLIEEILSKPKNNPMHTFEKFADIEDWLREQWAGLFRELLHRMSSQQQITTLSSQVEDLKEINNTLKLYLENVMSKVSPDESASIIKSEEERLVELEKLKNFEQSNWGSFLQSHYQLIVADAFDITKEVNSFEELAILVGEKSQKDNAKDELSGLLKEHSELRKLFNEVRAAMNLSALEINK